MTTSTSAPRFPLCGLAFRRPSGCWWCYKQFASMAGRQALMCSGFNSLQMTWLCRRATYLQPGPFAFCVRGWLLTWRWITWVRYGCWRGRVTVAYASAPCLSGSVMRTRDGFLGSILPCLLTPSLHTALVRCVRLEPTRLHSLSLPLGVLACPDSAGRVPKLLRVCQMQENGGRCNTRHVHPCWGDDVRGRGVHISQIWLVSLRSLAGAAALVSGSG